jgi:hypothetical protein
MSVVQYVRRKLLYRPKRQSMIIIIDVRVRRERVCLGEKHASHGAIREKLGLNHFPFMVSTRKRVKARL